MRMQDNFDVADAGKPEAAPPFWRLIIGLVFWSLGFAQEYLGPALASLSFAAVWWLLRYPTWPLTRARLYAKFGWPDATWIVAAIGSLIVVFVVHSMLVEKLPGVAVSTWAAFVLWSLVSALVITRFALARRRWSQSVGD